MKNKMTAIIASIGLMFAADQVLASPSVTLPSSKGQTHLIVINTWGQGAINVKEGTFLSKESTLSPGQNLDWTMFSGVINGLGIRYWNGGWQQIPGCPNGTYTNDLRVYVAAAPWDPNTPICHIA